ncbi:hypothetical protein Hdeb2414_s0023g00640651 [Helianthus debilis subsp. tardiflorus]
MYYGVSFRPSCGIPISSGTSQSIPLICMGHWFRLILDSYGEWRQLSTNGAFVVARLGTYTFSLTLIFSPNKVPD